MSERMLYEASLNGNVESLNKLLQQDRLTLARVSITCFNETPLHIAAMQGHVDFAKALLSHKPDLVTELDLHGRSPLHSASANGYIEIVKLLLAADTGACTIRDEDVLSTTDGRTPLHLAAMKGRVEIVTELARARQEVTRFVLDRGETVLHLCVVYNRLEALKVLVGMNTMADYVNVKDNDGNTILHTATMLKQVEIVKHLLLRTTAVKVNELNGNSITALDIIQHMPRDLKAVEIRELLVKAGGLMAERIPSLTTAAMPATKEQCLVVLEPQPSTVITEAPISAPPPQQEPDGLLKHLDQDHRLNRKHDSLMVVATLIAAMAFQAGLSPPGGVWQDDKVNTAIQRGVQQAGQSIVADKWPHLYIRFWISNTVSFIASLIIIFLLVSGLPMKKRVFLWILTAAMLVTITSTTLTYGFSMAIISQVEKDMATILVSSVFAWMCVLGIVFLGYTCGFVIWIIRMVRKCIKKARARFQVYN
ncbi:ankyrin repeat-containing protein BDA1-like [Actinidia eriantha]|uniref:ankyrin repeat-containing protein BDA1-like n=1 Tax=Actinidia eriantha TaxID=165200 RepID=UPI00258FFB8E|nr:ankyrin repeat-containing protein BDA1-like [Actinidia eriantha]